MFNYGFVPHPLPRMRRTRSDAATPHPLQKPWCLWFKGGKAAGQKASADDWDCGTLAFTFSTAEDFWCMYNNITPASKLPDKSDYYIFAEGIKPKYEDPVRPRIKEKNGT